MVDWVDDHMTTLSQFTRKSPELSDPHQAEPVPPSHPTGKCSHMRTPSTKTKSAPLDRVIMETLKLWRKYHLTYDQTRYVAKEVRRALAIVRPPTRQRVIARLSRTEEERLIAQ